MRRHLPEIAVLLASFSILLSAGLFWRSTNTFSKKETVDEIQKSRIVLSRESCRQRNQERRIQRSNLRRNLANIAQIPDGALEQLGFTRAEAVAQVERQLKQVAPLDCKKLVRRVAGNGQKASAVGGGAQANQPSRRPGEKSSDDETGKEGPSRPSGPEGPGETVPDTPEPAPDGGGSPSPGGGDSDGGGGGTVTPEVPPPTEAPSGGPIIDIPKIVDDVVDAVCQLTSPLGPLIQTCP